MNEHENNQPTTPQTPHPSSSSELQDLQQLQEKYSENSISSGNSFGMRVVYEDSETIGAPPSVPMPQAGAAQQDTPKQTQASPPVQEEPRYIKSEETPVVSGDYSYKDFGAVKAFYTGEDEPAAKPQAVPASTAQTPQAEPADKPKEEPQEEKKPEPQAQAESASESEPEPEADAKPKKEKPAPVEDAAPAKEGALRRFLPWKGDGVVEIIRKSVFLLAIITIVVSAGIILNRYVLEPYMADRGLEELHSNKINSGNYNSWAEIREQYPDVEFPDGMQLDLAAMYAQNQDLRGWIKISGMDIDLPVVQVENNDYYLKRSFKKTRSSYGTPFFDMTNSTTTLDRNTVIYGHTFKNETVMFSNLRDYRSIDGFKKAPVIECGTLYQDYYWKVYAVFISNGITRVGYNDYLINYTFTNVSSDKVFAEYIQELDRRKLYDTGVDMQPSDKILTLSTCAYDFDGARLVVVARLIRPGESTSVDTSKAVANENPQYPQIYYDERKMTNPWKGTSAEEWIPY